MSSHDQALATAFDKQAPRFERAPVQSDPAALARLVREADLPPDSLVLDSGCGPGLVAEALLAAGHRVVGVDLSSEMVERARKRCAAFGDRARFERRSLYDCDPTLAGPFDAAISRYVLHHMTDPSAFVARQCELIRPGGVLVLSDHTTDPDPDRARHHHEIECARDTTHTGNPTPGGILDRFAAAGLVELRLVEESFTLDFDEWFDRGTPASSKEAVRAQVLEGPTARGFSPILLVDGSIRIECMRAIARGVKPRIRP